MERVAAIIPTSGRDSLQLSVGSALAQSTRPEVVVVTSVANRDGVVSVLGELASEVSLVTVDHPTPTGGRLRQAGVEFADADWFAFLDDDDTWVEHKLSTQLAFARESDLDVVASALLLTGPDQAGRRVIPGDVYQPGQRVADYLFVGRSLRVDRPLLHTSTLLISKEAISAVPWDRSLQLHQDWDLVLRLDHAGFKFGQCAEALSIIETGSGKSMSATNKAEGSFEWWRRSRGVLGRRAAADFLYSQVLRYAIQERSVPGIRRVASVMRTTGLPRPSSLAIAGAGIVPRSAFERAMLFHAGADSGGRHGV